MPVVIFCGGRGTRLREETEFKPKPMVTIGGRPILWHIMKIYSAQGFHKFILCLGYKGNSIKSYFLQHKLWASDFRMRDGEVAERLTEYNDNDFDIVFADTGEDTPTGERLKMVQKYIPEDRFMVTYGDGVGNIDIQQLIAFHTQQKVQGTLTGVHPTSKYGLVSIDENQHITSFQQKPQLHDYVNGGYMLFERSFLQELREGEMIEETFQRLVDRQQLVLYKHDGFWHCMDTYKDYEDLNLMWNKGQPQWRIW
ncbi:MAG: NTP transferase domain-containing protein [Candidatus Kerfeldbacteria bacterium]|nr:NTP transferase domain-containing protein [Candidatus Kerfeldbacteria bacterium]